MGYKLKILNFAVDRPALMDWMDENNYELIAPFIPPEYDAEMNLKTAFWFVKKITPGTGVECDLSEIWAALSDLDTTMLRYIDDQVAIIVGRLIALEQSGGIAPATFEFSFDVWGHVDGGEAKITKPSSIKDLFGVINGGRLGARFTIDEGTTLAAGVLYIVPERKAQPTGYCRFFPGMFVHNCDKHGYMLNGVARWQHKDEITNWYVANGQPARFWGIRMQYSNFSLLRAFYPPQDKDGHLLDNISLQAWAAGGAWYAQKRPGKVLTAFGSDCFEVEIQRP